PLALDAARPVLEWARRAGFLRGTSGAPVAPPPPSARVERAGEYTARSRQALRAAREEANLVGKSTVDTEHLFLGLLREDARLAEFLAAAAGMDVDTIRRAIRSPFSAAAAPTGDVSVVQLGGLLAALEQSSLDVAHGRSI